MGLGSLRPMPHKVMMNCTTPCEVSPFSLALVLFPWYLFFVIAYSMHEEQAINMGYKRRLHEPILVSSIYLTACRSISSAFSCQLAHCCPQPANILALCWKNAAKIYRNPWLVIFQFLMPTLQVSLLCLTIGRSLHGISLAYFNNDSGGSVGE